MLTIEEKSYIWDELVEKIPHKWVVVENAELTSAGFIESGKLIGVCEDTEIDDFVISCYKNNKNINYEGQQKEVGLGL